MNKASAAGVWIKAGTFLFQASQVSSVNIERLKNLEIELTLQSGSKHVVNGIEAIEAVLLLKPSALEGINLKFPKNAWVFHNLIAHPVMQILCFFGFFKLAFKLHDSTVPRPSGFKS